MAVKRRRLTNANVAKLTPAAREYTVWDTRHAGLGVRVRPSGHRSFVYCRKGEGGPRRITLGPAALTDVYEARTKCLAIETGERFDPAPRPPVITFEDFVSGPGRACIDRCKPSTQKAVSWTLRARLLPAFGPMPLDRVTHASVTRWFDEYSRTAPGGANHALSVLLRILNHAVLCGHLDTNPARGIKPNPRPKLTRFLSREEVHRLHRALNRHADAPQADIIRLLLLTGCRRGEILTLRSAGLGRQHAQTGRRQGRTEKSVPERAGPCRPRAAAENRKRLDLSLAARSGETAFASPAALVLGTQGSRDRGRADPRPQAYVRQATPSCRASLCRSSLVCWATSTQA